MLVRIGIACALAIMAAIVSVGARSHQHDLLVRSFMETGILHLGASGAEVPLIPARELKRYWFARSHQADPVFSLAGTDTARLRQAIGFLLEKQETFLSVYEEQERSMLAAAQYPKEFLLLLPALEDKRRAMHATPSQAAIDDYQSHLISAMDAYLRGLRAFRDALEEYVGTESFAFPYGTATRASYLAWLDAAEAQVSAMRASAVDRYRCFRFFTKGCAARHALSFADIELPDHAHSELPLPSRSVLAALDALYAKDPRRASDDAFLIGAAWSCHNPKTAYAGYARVWWLHPFREQLHARKTSSTDDLYVYRYADDEPDPAYLSAYEAGMRTQNQITGHYYLCPDAFLDQSAIARTLALRELLIQHPVFVQGTTAREPYATLRDTEQRLTQGDSIEAADASGFVRDVQRLYAEGAGDLQDQIGYESMQTIEQGISLYRAGSWHADEMITEAALESGFIRVFADARGTTSIQDLLMMRSYPGIMFMAGNPTFLPRPGSLLSERAAYDEKKLASFKLASFQALLGQKPAAGMIREMLESIRIYREDEERR